MFDIEKYKSHLSYEDLLWYYLTAQTTGHIGRLRSQWCPDVYREMIEDLNFLNTKNMAKFDDS